MSGIIGRRESRGSGIPTPTKIKLPPSGGVYESDGSTALLTESGGTATLNNVTLGSAVVGLDTKIAMVWDEVSNTTGSGSSATSFTTRRLQTKYSSFTASDHAFDLDTSSYKFTLGAGTWLIQWSCPHTGSAGNGETRLIDGGSDGTGTTVLKYGASLFGDVSDPNNLFSTGSCVHVPSATNHYYIQQRCGIVASNGLGTPAGLEGVEIYTQVIMQKLDA